MGRCASCRAAPSCRHRSSTSRARSGLGGERGLLSIAFAPDYAISGLLYADATLSNGTIVVWEFHAAAGANVADAGHRLVLSIPHPATNHNGGQLQFGPDGYLYVSVGDGGVGANGQNAGVLLGKILRIDPRASGGQPYTIPPGQPFAPAPLPRSTPTASATRGASRSTASRAI